MKKATLSLFVFTLLVIPILAFGYSPAPGVRVNQVGYLPGDIKVAFVITNSNLAGQSFYLKSGSAIVYTAAVGADRGTYSAYSHLYELDFSNYNVPGTYTLQVSTYTSSPFKIGQGASVYSPILDSTMHYFRFQRCGNTVGAEPGYGNCHFDDAIAEGGPLSGKRIDAVGGWHDAANYPKLITTFGYGVMLMMVAYDRFQATGMFSTMSYPVLDEVKIGLDWVYKMWDPTHNVLYSQVADGSRVAYALDLQPGAGANIAGRAAASLAMGAYLWKDIDPALATKWQTAAMQIYDYGKARQKSWISPQYYEETDDPSLGWKDDMALAAVELYRSTNNPVYLNDALTNWLPGTNAETSASANGRSIAWWDMSSMANYEMARVYPDYKATAAAYLKNAVLAYANENHFKTAIPAGIWGTVEELACKAITELWYEDISGDPSYHRIADQQRDYIFGRNPWGYSFVDRAGTYYMQNMYRGPTHTGWWGEGPASIAGLSQDGFPVSPGPFDTQDWWYKDDPNNYVVNEHTVTANSAGFHLIAWYSQGNRTTFSITASAGVNGTISPSGTVSVVQGANQTFTITAAAGYAVEAVMVDGVNQGGITSYTFTSVQANHSINATFKVQTPITYVISASAGANGTISPSGSVVVNQGANQTFTIRASSGYTMDTVSVDGQSQGAITSYTFSSVSANHSIGATFKVNATDSNIAPGGTGYIWSNMTSSTSNSGRATARGVNDQNLTANVNISTGDRVNAWEAAGVTFTSAKSISSVTFINGDITSGNDGNFEANVKLQFSADGGTWTDSGWSISPQYPYSSAAGGKTYAFSGTSTSSKKGARIVGQVRVKGISYFWRVKEVQIFGH